MWHVRDRERDLLFDSGMGVVSLKRHVALVTEKPLLSVASHCHFDHVGGIMSSTRASVTPRKRIS